MKNGWLTKEFDPFFHVGQKLFHLFIMRCDIPKYNVRNSTITRYKHVQEIKVGCVKKLGN